MAEEKKDREVSYEEEKEDGAPADPQEKLKKIKEQLKQCQQEKQEYLAGWQRAQADFINYKRRQEEQAAEWAKIFGEGLIRDLLPVLDALEPQNYAEIDAEQRGNKDLLNGFKIIREQLMSVLNKHGLEEIKSIGEKFDPQWHEAVGQAESGGNEGAVAEEVQKGYALNGKVIRAAKVKVIK
jgi:molecular chaperone GrpE